MVITLQALQLKEETATVEMKEQQLVLDCVKQLGVLISIQIKYHYYPAAMGRKWGISRSLQLTRSF